MYKELFYDLPFEGVPEFKPDEKVTEGMKVFHQLETFSQNLF